jgi:IS4 transposase
MSSSTNSAPGMLWRFALVSRSFLAQSGLPFAEALPEERIAQAFAEEETDFPSPHADEDDLVYTPTVTLWAFLSQMLYGDEQRSCLAAVARVAVLWAALGKQVCASNSGAYCRARAKLTEGMLERLPANWTTNANEHTEAFPAEELATLYRRRWLVELDLRTLKSTLKLDVLRCESPGFDWQY